MDINNSVPVFLTNLKSKMAASKGNAMDIVPESSGDADTTKDITASSGEAPKGNVYPNDHEGDFLVLVDSSRADPGNGKIRNSLFLYQKIRKIRVSGIRLITPIGRTLYRIKFDSAASANDFVGKDLNPLGLKAFIPDTFIFSYGVIHGIPLELSDEYIRETSTSDVEIVSVKRFVKKDQSNGVDLPTFSVKLGFRSGNIPEHIVLDFSYIKVNIYYPPLRQCHNCGRLGHTSKGCRSKKRCLNCSKEICDGNCFKKCLLCGNLSHSSKDRKLCPKWKEEDDILKIMTIKRLSRSEVIKSYATNRFDIFNEYTDNFPALPLAKSTPVKDRDKEVNKILMAQKYNRVVYTKPPPPKPKPHFAPIQPTNTDPTSPVIYRENNARVSDFEKLLADLSLFIGNLCNKGGTSSHLRLLNDFNSKISNALANLRITCDPPSSLSIPE